MLVRLVQAANLDATLRKGQHEVSLAAKAAAAAAEQQKHKQQGHAGTPNGRVAGAAAGPQSASPGSASKEQEEADAQRLADAVAALEANQARAVQLAALFRQPDLQCGSLAAIHGPPGGQLEGRTLLRVDMGELRYVSDLRVELD